MTTDLSIIIATRDSAAFIEPCLSSLATADDGLRTEIIVVDNASHDRTVAIIRSRFPQVTVITNVVNQGHCRAMNTGFMAARGTYLMALDADTVVLSGAVQGLVNFLRARKDVAVVAPRMVNVDGTLQETARRFPGVINALFGRQTMLTRWFPDNRFSRAYLQREQYRDTEPFHVDWVSAACMVFPRSLIERLGLWDEGFGGYWVDADWCARAHVAGGIYCVPAARVVHVEQNRGPRRKGARRILQFHAGVHRFYRKHYTRGLFDPRSIAAAVGLAARAAVLIGIDVARPVSSESVAKREPHPARPLAPHVSIGKGER